jgi:hypothetical protein
LVLATCAEADAGAAVVAGAATVAGFAVVGSGAAGCLQPASIAIATASATYLFL